MQYHLLNKKEYLVIVLLICLPFFGKAQIDLATGIDLSYPLLLNKENTKWNYNQISFGLRFGIAYKPDNTQFFPMLNFNFGRTRLPLKQIEGSNVAALNFNYLNLMLNENYIVHFPKSTLYIYGGLGVAFLFQEGLTVTGKNAGTANINIDSTANTNKAFPSINLGLEYLYGESINTNLYLSMGINFQYIYLLPERNTYYFTYSQDRYTYDPYQASFTGHVINPGFYITVHYRLGPKRSSYYLN